MFEETISRVASALKNRHMPYIIIGGQAVLLYGEPGFTRDIDITLGVNVDSLKEVLSIAETLNISENG